jgi:NAD(P)-dependent dehydrogenase (short-subunit alcohol dehydrogenase family)
MRGGAGDVDSRFLAGRAAVVTGGGAGIGAAVADSLAAAGAAVAVLDLSEARARASAQRLAACGTRAVAVPVDATDQEALRVAVEEAAGRLGRLDVLVNNVGGTRHRMLVEQRPASWQRLIALNLTSALTASVAAVPWLRAARGGSIVNVSSIEAVRAAPGFAVYAACKAGLESLTRSMAVEFADDGIRVNAIAPDHTATPGVRGMAPDYTCEPPEPAAGERDALARLVPLGREGTAAECGAVAAFLASPAAAYVTGAVIPVDGGTAAAGGWHRDSAGRWQLVNGYRFGGEQG